MASSQGNGRFTEFIRLLGADYLPKIAKILPADTISLIRQTFFRQFVVLPIC